MPQPTKPSADQKSTKPSRKAPPAVKPTAAAKKTAAKEPQVNPSSSPIASSEERHRLIAQAAYYLAEKRGFQGGNPEQDWLEAAAQVDTLFMDSGKGQNT